MLPVDLPAHAAGASGRLRARMRVLYVTTPGRPGGWLAQALAADSAAQVELCEAHGEGAAMALLREESFDAVLIGHEPLVMDAFDFTAGLRAGGGEEPVVVLGTEPEGEMAALTFEAGADGYARLGEATVRTLLWLVARAVERQQLVRENRRLAAAERRRLQREHREAEQLLGAQRLLVRDLEAIASAKGQNRDPANDSLATRCETHVAHGAAQTAPQPASGPVAPLPAELVDEYRDLLRSYVIMGSGRMPVELARLAGLLAKHRFSAARTLELHLHALEGLVRGLGNRGSRHVLTRADLLILEVMIDLCEAYRDEKGH